VTDKPKTPDRFDAFESDHPRAMTAYEPFDSRPKLHAVPPVADPLEGVPRLRAPSNVGEPRDTDADELTPAERPFEIRVMERLSKLEQSHRKQGDDITLIKKSGRKAAQLALETHNLVKAIDSRQRAYDLERRWVPYLVWLVVAAIAVIALIRTYR